MPTVLSMARERATQAILRDLLRKKAMTQMKERINNHLGLNEDEVGPLLTALETGMMKKDQPMEAIVDKKKDKFGAGVHKVEDLPAEYVITTIVKATGDAIDRVTLVRVRIAAGLKGSDELRKVFCLLFGVALEDMLPTRFKSIATLVFMQRYKEMGYRGTKDKGVFVVSVAHGLMDFSGDPSGGGIFNIKRNEEEMLWKVTYSVRP